MAFARPGDLFGAVNGLAGGELAIVGFNAGNDSLQLQGYGSNAASTALASAAIVGGTTILTLPDATRIVLFDVADLGTSAFI